MNALRRTLDYAGLSLLGAGSKLVGKNRLGKAMERSLADKMSGMRGIPLKVSQILGMGQTEMSTVHRLSQVEIEPMPKAEVLHLIGESSPELLSEGELLADVFCASLGQVNRFQKDSVDYAVKVQYPDSEKNLLMDNQAFKLVTSSFGQFAKGFNLSEYQQTMKQELLQELDYSRELEMQHEFFRIFSSEKDIVIPLAFSKFSTDSCLVMSWEDSLCLDDFLAVANEDLKKQAAKLISHFYMVSIFQHGLLHADPNPGNFGFRINRNGVQLVVYDFGSVIKLTNDQHIDLLALFKMTTANQNPFGALLALGFDYDLLSPLSDRLSAMMMVLLDPFIAEQKFKLSQWQRKERIQDILDDDRWNFMVAAPADLFLFMRSLSGLLYYSEKLTGELFCRRDLERAFEVHSREVNKVVEGFLNDAPQETSLSKQLIISVKECEKQKVKLTLPARAIENLSTLIPPDIIVKLEEEKIDIQSLVKGVRQNAYRPQNVFELVDGSKKIMVDLV